MKRKPVIAIATCIAAGAMGLGVAPAAYAASCSTGNMCSFTGTSYTGTIYHGGNGDFVEVTDDVTQSARNATSKNYNAKNNTAVAQEETIAYIARGASIATFGGNNNKIDHYRRA